VTATETIDLHGLSLAEARTRLADGLAAARRHGERVVCIVHGQGKHSEAFPVIKSHVRRWLEESTFAREQVEMVYRGEDGSPYTRPNAGQIVVLLKADGAAGVQPAMPPMAWEEEEAREARQHAKGMRADRLRTARRRGPRR